MCIAYLILRVFVRRRRLYGAALVAVVVGGSIDPVLGGSDDSLVALGGSLSAMVRGISLIESSFFSCAKTILFLACNILNTAKKSFSGIMYDGIPAFE